uniref:Golgi associated, gamma adaptin ear containing, ARF binding protein 1 n=1 Tax=Pipistrellus kuhlii TaxID=59472 RepID=A0A7J7ZI70_PIPKU|nr:golgi associated, gamma adaptin ear containing, ARF binding protein 1 [Pipistrellus kuhlii]
METPLPAPSLGAPRPCWTSQAWISLLQAPPTQPCPPALSPRPAPSSPAPPSPCLTMSSCLWASVTPHHPQAQAWMVLDGTASSHLTAPSPPSPLQHPARTAGTPLRHPCQRAVVWMTWTSWGRPCYSSHCPRSPNKCGGSILPVTVYDQHGFRVLFHFARDPLPGRSDVLVVVVSMLSTAPQPIRNIVFQSAVPKVMKVKLQPPSGTELPAFNPIVHPSAITQVLLLANPQKEKVRLRYKLLFTMGDQTYNEMGDVDQFPPPDTWGSL